MGPTVRLYEVRAKLNPCMAVDVCYSASTQEVTVPAAHPGSTRIELLSRKLEPFAPAFQLFTTGKSVSMLSAEQVRNYMNELFYFAVHQGCFPIAFITVRQACSFIQTTDIVPIDYLWQTPQGR